MPTISFHRRPWQHETARGFYNAGTEQLRAGKLGDAETLLESSLARQDEQVQPAALFNLGHVRFAQGTEELKKSPAGAAKQSQAAMPTARARFKRRRTRWRAMTCSKWWTLIMAGSWNAQGNARGDEGGSACDGTIWQNPGRNGGARWSDFKSAAELNPADTNAVHNAEVVEQAIAKLVDSLREMQQVATNLGGKKVELDQLMKQLKGKIPAPNMPPGAAGGEEDEEGDDGKPPSPESLTGLEESDKGGGGQEMSLKISPEQAGQLMNSLQPDGKQLPMAPGELGRPKDRSGRIW